MESSKSGRKKSKPQDSGRPSLHHRSAVAKLNEDQAKYDALEKESDDLLELRHIVFLAEDVEPTVECPTHYF